MSGCTMAHLRVIRDRAPQRPTIFVETGTLEGKGIARALPLFHEVHSIELDPLLHARAAHAYPTATCHLGDSRDVVPRLASRWQEPVCWYLDAHWFPKDGVAGRAEGLPLWEELATLAARPHADTVIVDDVHSFGTDRPTPEWRHISLDRIASCFPGHHEAVILGDQAVVYR